MSSIGPVVTEEKMFENVDGQGTDVGVTGILLAQGSGELKSLCNQNNSRSDCSNEQSDLELSVCILLQTSLIIHFFD